MSIFKRKKKQEIHIEAPAHVCVMKDLPWYMEVEYNSREETASYKIIEPYICITGCQKRINKILEECAWSNIDAETRAKYFNRIKKKYADYLKPRAIVEDMINNIFLVKDPDYLENVEKLRGTPHRGCGTSAQMKSENHYRIEVKE